MLSLLSNLYGRIADARNQLYERGVFETLDLGTRTISIGNVTAGGTGKTPLVAYVCNILAERGEKVCILTRGYGRLDPKRRVLVSDGKTILADAVTAGDEPYELAQKFLGKVIVIADADRVAAAEWARRKFGITAFVLDDGFQHRKAKRDVDIVCIDATNPFGGGEMLPKGRLREPLHNLERANIIVITRADLVDNIEDLKYKVSKRSPDAAVFTSENLVKGVTALENLHAVKRRSRSLTFETDTFAFCALGNPESFFAQVRKDKRHLSGTRVFPDHHTYTQQEIDDLHAAAYRSSASAFLTTAKDAVKLSNLKFEIPCYVVEIEMQLDDRNGFGALL